MHRQSTIQIDIQTLAPPGCRRGKVLAGASNLANLLPTGTVLTFQTLIPSFTDGVITHKYLTLGLFLLLLHGQFHRSERKNTLWNRVSERLLTMSKDALKEYLRSYSLKRMDFIRALVSLMVFLTFAIGDANVQDCYCHPKSNPNIYGSFVHEFTALFSLLFFLLLVGELAMPIAITPREPPNYVHASSS